jgi:DNA-directed RNA polymerase sigma subunit (sigma70/sigma32)
LDRSGEVEIAKRIEIAERERLVCALQSPLVVGYLDTLLKRLQQGELALEEISEESDKTPRESSDRLEALLTVLTEITQRAGMVKRSGKTAKHIMPPEELQSCLERLRMLNFKSLLLEEILEDLKIRYQTLNALERSVSGDELAVLQILVENLEPIEERLKQAKKEMIEANLRLVVSIAKKLTAVCHSWT